MLLPARAVDVVNALYTANIRLARGSDDDRRKLTRMIAEQLCFDLGNNWGTKAQSASHPQSKDAIAYRLSGGAMDVWDWQNGTTREPQVNPNQAPDYPGLTGQFFIAVTPTNHLGSEPGPTPNPDLEKIVEMLKTIQHDLVEITTLCQQILMKPCDVQIEFPVPPDYELRLFGRVVGTMKPKE